MIPDLLILFGGVLIGSLLGVVAGIHYILQNPDEFQNKVEEKT